MPRFLRTYIVALHAVAVVMVLAIATPCQAQGFSGGCFNCGCPACAGGASYQGPGDLSFGAAVAAFSFRCYSAAYSGNVADITDSATGTTTGTRLQCSGGVVSALVSGSACTFVTGNACSPTATTCAVACNVRTWYDQSGQTNCTTACDVTQTTNANRPTYLDNSATCGTNSKSCLSCPGTAGTLLTSASLASSVAQSVFASSVLNFNSTNSALRPWVIGAGVTYITHGGNFNQIKNASSTQSGPITVTDAAWHALNIIFNGASSAVNNNGTTTSSLSAGVVSASGTFRICATAAASSDYFAGTQAELIIWPSTSTFAAATILSNQQAFYGGMTVP